jgi:hypothetical protein
MSVELVKRSSGAAAAPAQARPRAGLEMLKCAWTGGAAQGGLGRTCRQALPVAAHAGEVPLQGGEFRSAQCWCDACMRAQPWGTGAGRVCGASRNFQISARGTSWGVWSAGSGVPRASSVFRAGLRCCRVRGRLWGRLQVCPPARWVEQKEGHALLPARNRPNSGCRVGPCVLPRRRAVTRSRQGARRRMRELARGTRHSLPAALARTSRGRGLALGCALNWPLHGGLVIVTRPPSLCYAAPRQSLPALQQAHWSKCFTAGKRSRTTDRGASAARCRAD